MTPRQVERAFAGRGIPLDNSEIYTNQDRPIIRSYVIFDQKSDMSAGLLVYDSVDDAAAAERIDQSRNRIRRANLIVWFTRDASSAAQRQIKAALNSAAPG